MLTRKRIRLSRITALLCSLTIPIAAMPTFAQEQAPPAANAPPDNAPPANAAPEEPAAKIPNEQLDSLVAPIALYPDPLLAQVLAASTYPLEVAQLQNWLGQNGGLKDQALTDAVSKQDWDPSVQAMAPFPEVVKMMSSDIKWTTDLGNAFLAQQNDVMAAVQRMRQKAKGKGSLASNEQIKVETKTVESEPVIIIEQSKPDVVYVPSYDPAVVYGAPVASYPYPAVTYPWGAVAGAALTFGAGVAIGAAFSGGWGWGCGWGGGAHDNNININNNNNFVKNSSARGGNVAAGNGKWQHNGAHRGGAPYGNRQVANKYGGGATRDSARAAQAGRGGGVGGPGGVGGAGGAGGRGGVGGAGGAGGVGGRDVGQRGGVGGAGGAGGRDVGDRGGVGGRDVGGRGGVGPQPGPGGGDRGRAGGAGGASGGDRVGNRSVSPSGGGSRGGDALGGSRGSYSGQAAQRSSARGSSSMGSRSSGGGASRGGGGGGGGARGGGGRSGGGGGGRGGGRR